MTADLARSSLDDALGYFTARTGLVFPAPRRVEFDAGVLRVMARYNIRELSELPSAIRFDPRLLDELVGQLAVHESYFFREPGQFEALRRRVLPALRRERGEQAVLNIWSAGCARGEEPYSLAILLEQEGLSKRCRILATDLSRAALVEAAMAHYSTWSFRGGAADLGQRYFHRHGSKFHLDDRIKRQVTFDVVNLVSGPFTPPASGGFDLIFCRNVLIYFEAATVARVAGWLYGALAEGGWLVTAPADPALSDYAPFEALMTPEGLLYRRPPTAARALSQTPARPSPAACAPRVQSTQERGAPARNVAAGRRRRTGPAAPALADATDCLVQIRALADAGRSAAAERLAATSAAQHPLSCELHYLRAFLLLELGRKNEALDAVRQVLYLDRTLIAAHLLLGAMLRAKGAFPGALRAYRNALLHCGDRAADAPAELADGAPVGRLAALAATEIAALEAWGVAS